jgi:hypothetical protein
VCVCCPSQPPYLGVLERLRLEVDTDLSAAAQGRVLSVLSDGETAVSGGGPHVPDTHTHTFELYENARMKGEPYGHVKRPCGAGQALEGGVCALCCPACCVSAAHCLSLLFLLMTSTQSATRYTE